ncbi:hypothetical protein CAL26_20755 [Bordetella genomosp. 9]|uniref:Lactate dehydrogenase n=1 Tax=Bordetella genomosp. 9 TaxID=1416803 RepID=A0A261R4N6_9BORD|nr:hypothetical protein [Bordetella genomosp. 9]OZI19989.1 hypothetical protein CAL26_20755 [Bordetella genomosp. 9]
MQSLLPLNAASASAATLAPAAPVPADPKNAAPGVSTPANSATVTLTDAETARLNQTYDDTGALSVSTPVWEKDSSDAISALMSKNYDATAVGDRFRGLGAALLDRFQLGGGDYSQSVILRTTDSGSAGATSRLDQIRQTQLHTVADNQITLDVKTAGGATVHLSLTSQAGGLGVQVEVTGGTLSTAERNALSGLADAFQGAIDGLTSVPPKLSLEGLTKFDPNVLSSVNLQASFKMPDGSVQSLDFQADSQHRSVDFTGAAGKVSVNVDLSNPSLIGSADQQAHALASYMQQFDQAQSRGQGNAALMAMFKDAFGALNSNYSVDQKHLAMAPVIPLSDADHAMLSGLADFSASVQAPDSSPNPMRPEEHDAFSYQVSQQTKIQGSGANDRAIEQTQQSHLSASYHQSLYPDTPLNLTGDKFSQNYYYYKVDDTASSVASIAYKDGRLTKASLTQTASQNMDVSKYVAGELQERLNTPSSVSRSWDMLHLIQASMPKDDGSATEQDRANWRNTLSNINSLVVLKSDPSQLRSAQLAGAKETAS